MFFCGALLRSDGVLAEQYWANLDKVLGSDHRRSTKSPTSPTFAWLTLLGSYMILRCIELKNLSQQSRLAMQDAECFVSLVAQVGWMML